MPTYQRPGKQIEQMAAALLAEFETHAPILDAKVKIDFVMAFADVDDSGNKKGFAITHRNRQVFGQCRKVKIKDRAMGRGDAEITLDGDWWATASVAEQRALLDHELHHIVVRTEMGVAIRDDLGRPKLGMRLHDVEFGWFNEIAARHGAASQEQQQAKQIMDAWGQYYWPEMGQEAAPAKQPKLSRNGEPMSPPIAAAMATIGAAIARSKGKRR
jgi:hypothetical protein